MASDGVKTVPFYRSGTFWSLVVAALGQILQAALGPDGAAQRFFSEPLPGGVTETLASGGDLATWAGLALAFWRRAVASRRWTF